MELLPEETASEAFSRSPRTEALLRQTINLFGEYAQQVGGLPEELQAAVLDCRDLG